MADNLWILNANSGDTSYPITVSSSPDGQSWGAPRQLANIPQCPVFPPSMVTYQGKAYVTYAGSDNTVVVGSSADGVTWTTMELVDHDPDTGYRTKVYTNAAPSIAVHGHELLVAYTDYNSGSIMIQGWEEGYDDWYDPVDTGQKTNTGPSMIAFKGNVFLAYPSGGLDNSILICSRPDGITWTPSTDTGQGTHFSASLAVLGERMFVAYVAHNMDYPVRVSSSADGNTWTQPAEVNQTSWFAPSLVAFNGNLWLSFVGLPVVEGSSYMNVCSSADGEKWSPYLNLNRTTGNAPTLAVAPFSV